MCCTRGMPHPGSNPSPDEFVGRAHVSIGERTLGLVQVRLTQIVDERSPGSWGGSIVNSDYLLWGIAGHRLVLRLPDGREGECVVRTAGTVIGFGPAPFG